MAWTGLLVIGVLCLVSGVWCLQSGVGCLGSGVWCLVSAVLCRVSGPQIVPYRDPAQGKAPLQCINADFWGNARRKPVYWLLCIFGMLLMHQLVID